MSFINDDLLEKYNKTRLTQSPQFICHAPFNNMYFNVHGNVGACWNTFWNSPKWPEQSIREIWFGDFFSNLRENIQARDLVTSCYVCDKNIRTGNYLGTLAQAYDNNFPLTNYPSVMELELSNRCNLECIMCTGELSSSIRKNRDNLPPLSIPYDQRFVDELKEFLPHLKDMRFNGGEPFLQEICYSIWDQIALINPEIEITIATNGTVLNSRIKELLEKCKFRINISVDSLSKENYETIRKNGNFDKLLEHVDYYGEYCKKNNRIFSIMINPMRQNWWEMPDFVHWCNEKNYHLWFNTVVSPASCSLMGWDESNLKEVYTKLSADQGFKISNSIDVGHIHSSNVKKYQNLVENMIKVWWKQRESL